MDYKEKILKYQKEILIIFGLLDALVLGRCIFQIKCFIEAFSFSSWHGVLMLLQTIVILSLSFSAFGLACQKKWAFILSYCQFPFRYVFFLLSFTFISFFLPRCQIFVYISPAIAIAMILEVLRLATTIIIHKNYSHHQKTTPPA
jgi:hypothetical protein